MFDAGSMLKPTCCAIVWQKVRVKVSRNTQKYLLDEGRLIDGYKMNDFLGVFLLIEGGNDKEKVGS